MQNCHRVSGTVGEGSDGEERQTLISIRGAFVQVSEHVRMRRRCPNRFRMYAVDEGERTRSASVVFIARAAGTSEELDTQC